MSTAATGGARVAELRKTRGITQAALARRAGISLSLLSKIEVGDRTLTPAIAVAIAGALRISLDSLYRRPEVSEDQSALLEDLRTAVRRYDIPDQTPVPDPAQLHADLDHAITRCAQADLVGLLRTLPNLLTRATTYAHAVTSAQGWALLADVYTNIWSLALRKGWMDLIELAPDRQAWAAAQHPNPLVKILSARTRAGTFLKCGDFEGGLAVVDRAVMTAEATLSGAEKAFATGALHSRGITLAGRLGDRTEAQRHIHATWTAAEQFPDDLLIHNVRFGPAVTAGSVLHTEGDLGRPRDVIRLSEELTSKNTKLPPIWMCDVHTSTARAHLDLGDRDNAQTSLVQAFHVAPQKAKVYPESLEVLRVLISLYQRSNPQLIALAKLAGLVT